MIIFCLHFALNQSFLQPNTRHMQPVSEMKNDFTEIFQREMLDFYFVIFEQFSQEIENDQKFLGWVWFIPGQICHVKFIKFVRSSDFNMIYKMTKYFEIFLRRSFSLDFFPKNHQKRVEMVETSKNMTRFAHTQNN